jgi:hypothetical protein
VLVAGFSLAGALPGEACASTDAGKSQPPHRVRMPEASNFVFIVCMNDTVLGAA